MLLASPTILLMKEPPSRDYLTLDVIHNTARLVIKLQALQQVNGCSRCREERQKLHGHLTLQPPGPWDQDNRDLSGSIWAFNPEAKAPANGMRFLISLSRSPLYNSRLAEQPLGQEPAGGGRPRLLRHVRGQAVLLRSGGSASARRGKTGYDPALRTVRAGWVHQDFYDGRYPRGESSTGFPKAADTPRGD